MIRHDIDDNMNTVLVRFGTHGGKFCFVAERRITGIVNAELSRLIIDPPHGICLAFGAFLGLLDNRSLNRGVTCLCDLFHVVLDVVERPLPCVKNNAFLTGIHQAVISGSGTDFSGNRASVDSTQTGIGGYRCCQ